MTVLVMHPQGRSMRGFVKINVPDVVFADPAYWVYKVGGGIVYSFEYVDQKLHAYVGSRFMTTNAKAVRGDDQQLRTYVARYLNKKWENLVNGLGPDYAWSIIRPTVGYQDLFHKTGRVKVKANLRSVCQELEDAKQILLGVEFR